MSDIVRHRSWFSTDFSSLHDLKCLETVVLGSAVNREVA